MSPRAHDAVVPAVPVTDLIRDVDANIDAILTWLHLRACKRRRDSASISSAAPTG
jgi:hypothetical protein